MHDIVTWVAVGASLAGFGLAMGLNPALYGATADMLARDVPVRARLLWMMTGLAVGATILLLIFRSVDPARLVAASQGEINAVLVNRVVDLVAGIAFLVAAAVVLWWRYRVPAIPYRAPTHRKAKTGPFSYLFIGLGACVGFTTLPIMYLTGRVISGFTADAALRMGAYALFLLSLVAPFFALAWLWSRFPVFTGRVTRFYARALRWDYRPVLVAVFVLASLLFFGLALFAQRLSAGSV